MVFDGILIGHIREMCKDAADEAVCLLSVYIWSVFTYGLNMCVRKKAPVFLSVGQVGKLAVVSPQTNNRERRKHT